MDLQQTKADITNGISQEQLKQQVTREHAREISLKMTGWEDWASALELTRMQIEDIDSRNRTMRTKRLAVLEVWKESFGTMATYEKLINALLKFELRKTAEFVCSLLLKTPSATKEDCSVKSVVGGPRPGVHDDMVNPCQSLHQPSHNQSSRRVSERRKKLLKKKHHHKKNCKHHQRRSLSDSEHRHRKSKCSRSPSSGSSEASSEAVSDSDASTDQNHVSSNDSSSEQEYNSRRLPKHSKPNAKHRKNLRVTKQKHHHKKNCKHHQHRSLSDGEHRYRKSSSGVGDPHKRKRRHSPSSSSSEASSETGSDNDASTNRGSVSSNDSSSEQECSSRKHPKPSAKHRRKKAKHLPKTSQAIAKGRKLRAVFREHFAALMLLVSNPEQLAAQLYSKSLVSPATLDKIITLPISRQQKVLHLLLDLDRKICADPDKLFVFIQVIQGDPSLEEFAEKMLHSNLKLILPRLGCPRLSPLQRLAHQLRRGPSGSQLKLKRAQSLPCLSKYSHSSSALPGREQLSRSHSAPDLALIEIISFLHPSLTNLLDFPSSIRNPW